MRGPLVAALVLAAACSVPEKFPALPESVRTTAPDDVVVGAARIRDGVLTQHGALFNGLTPLAGRYELALPPGVIPNTGAPTCTCTTETGAVLCDIGSSFQEVRVTETDVDVICFGRTQQMMEVAEHLVVTRDLSAITVASARVAADGTVSSDGDWVRSATPTGLAFDLALEPVFAAPPICTCTWTGDLDDECVLGDVSTTVLQVANTSAGGVGVDIQCVGPSADGAPDEAVISPADGGTVIASGSIQSDNAISWQDGDWMALVTGADGDHTIRYRAGTFAGTPRCTCTSIGAGGCTLASVDETEVHVRVTNRGGGLAANAFMITCVGPR